MKLYEYDIAYEDAARQFDMSYERYMAFMYFLREEFGTYEATNIDMILSDIKSRNRPKEFDKILKKYHIVLTDNVSKNLKYLNLRWKKFNPEEREDIAFGIAAGHKNDLYICVLLDQYSRVKEYYDMLKALDDIHLKRIIWDGMSKSTRSELILRKIRAGKFKEEF